MQIQPKIRLKLLRIELEIAHLRQLVHLLNEEHGIVLRVCHEEVVIGQTHQAVQFDRLPIFLPILVQTHIFTPQELQLIIFQVRVVERTENVGDAQPLRNTLRLLILLLVESDVVVFGDILQRAQQIIPHVLLSLLLLHDDRSFDVQVIFFLQNVVEGRISTPIDANLLKLVPEVVLNRLLLESFTLDDHIILAFQHEAVQNEVLLLEQVSLLEESDNSLRINIIVALFNVHCHEVEVWFVDSTPLFHKFLIFLHNIVIVENGETKLMLIHFGFQIF